MRKLWQLFFTFFKIGLFTFGGGYAMISLIHNEAVSKHKWLSEEEMLDIVAIAEATPGPIAINSATYVGHKRAGVIGSVFATLGVVIPSFCIILIISLFIDEFLKIKLVSDAFKGIQAGIAVIIIRAGLKMTKSIKKDAVSIALMVLSFAVMMIINFLTFNLSAIYLIITGGIVGLIYYGFIKKDGKTDSKTDEQKEEENAVS